MLNQFVRYTRCAELALEPLAAILRRDRHSAENNVIGADAGAVRPLASTRQHISDLIARSTSFEATRGILTKIEGAIDMLRLERYVDNSVSNDNLPGMKSLVRGGYYMLRPLLPVSFRKHLQRLALRDWDAIPFPKWPIDLTTEELIEATWRILLTASGTDKIPFIWFWPEGYLSACIMTHDVETEAGRDFCVTMMKMEQKFGIHSAFEVVPEERYPVPDQFLQEIRDQGCEVCVHGLNHDGRLFSSEAIFLERARRINEYAERWGAKGFRSPVMYRNLDWLHRLHFSYDMSIPNVGHLDPQRGGCCTVMPYFIGDILELPLTTIQDYSLFNILQQRSLDLWIEQTRAIQKKHGLISFIIHPDYVTEPWSSQIYERLLDRLSVLRADDSVWMALPRDVDTWWRARQEMRLVREGGVWRIEGPQAERAKVAYAALDKGSVVYHF
jgi:hypothetical protein